jgi:WD40 repeat protein
LQQVEQQLKASTSSGSSSKAKSTSISGQQPLTTTTPPLPKPATRSPLTSVATGKEKPLSARSSVTAIKTNRSTSSTSIEISSSSNLSAGVNCSQTFLKELGQIRLFLKGRPVTFHLPTARANFDPDAALEAPKSDLKLEWVYGYRGKDSRSNLYKLPTGELIYYIASIAVLFNPDERTQRHYTQHTNDIKSLAIHPDRVKVATGQATGHGADARAHVRIWETVTLTTLKIITNDFQNAICCLAFSHANAGQQLAIVDDAAERTMSLWSWESGTKLAHAKCYGDAVLACEFHPTRKDTLVTCGKQHVIVWTLDTTASGNGGAVHLNRKVASLFDSLKD